MDKSLVKYLRLSLDDGGGESNSIESQRHIIDDYIYTASDLAGIPVMEFTDDGYTGTNFNRPGVKKLLEAVRRGEVSCIIVKDLSRFGRKYLEVSRYLEQLFPYLGLRFISVNDHYDSNNHKGTSAEMDIPLRNLINAYYSKQVSKKVRDAKRLQISQGKNINAFARYGYRKDPQDIHRIIIDEPAAEVVRRIFELSCSGQGPTQIANTLNADGILTPYEYKKHNGSNIKINSAISALWSNAGVIGILREEQYTGTLISGKVEMGELGTGKIIYKPKDEWTKMPGAFPAIISMGTWQIAVAMRGKHGGNRGNPDTSRILYKRVRCGHCNHVMRYRTNKGTNRYFCETPRHTAEHGCLSEKYSEQWLVDVVKTVVQKQIALMLDMDKLCRDGKQAVQKNTESTQTAAARLDSEIAQLQSYKRNMYERYKNGSLGKTEYFNEREAVENDMAAKTAEREVLLSQSDGQGGAYNCAQRFFGSFLAYQYDTEPSAEVVNALVKSIHVFDKDRVEITFSFKDELEQVILQLTKFGVTYPVLSE